MPQLLLCTDLDRTPLPSGPRAESAGAHGWFSAFIAHHDIALVHVSGRMRKQVRQAITDYCLPRSERR